MPCIVDDLRTLAEPLEGTVLVFCRRVLSFLEELAAEEDSIVAVKDDSDNALGNRGGLDPGELNTEAFIEPVIIEEVEARLVDKLHCDKLS